MVGKSLNDKPVPPTSIGGPTTAHSISQASPVGREVNIAGEQATRENRQDAPKQIEASLFIFLLQNLFQSTNDTISIKKEKRRGERLRPAVCGIRQNKQ